MDIMFIMIVLIITIFIIVMIMIIMIIITIIIMNIMTITIMTMIMMTMECFLPPCAPSASWQISPHAAPLGRREYQQRNQWKRISFHSKSFFLSHMS